MLVSTREVGAAQSLGSMRDRVNDLLAHAPADLGSGCNSVVMTHQKRLSSPSQPTY
jgi:hypothetical protein